MLSSIGFDMFSFISLVMVTTTIPVALAMPHRHSHNNLHTRTDSLHGKHSHIQSHGNLYTHGGSLHGKHSHIQIHSGGHVYERRNDPVSQLLYIAPTSNSCAGAEFPAECVVSSTSIAQVIVKGFAKYNVTTAAEQAALLSWMAYESGEWKYNQNHFPAPGRPGQGTRVMMMPNYVLEYARSIDELSAQVTSAGEDVGAVLSLVQPDEYSFAAAAWYYATQCGEQVKDMVRSGSQAGWTAFVQECVVTSVNGDREAYWVRASQALGVS